MNNHTLKSISPSFHRRFFGSRRLDLIPNLIAISKDSYAEFIQEDPEKRDPTKGLEWVFQKTIHLNDSKGTMSLKYIHYELKDPKFSIEECKLQGITYAYSLSVVCHVTFYDKDAKNKDKKVILEESETKIHMGEIPKMCPDGTFIINGITKTIISQIQRIPGIFFVHEGRKKKKKIGYQNYVAKLVPYYGSWMEFFVEHKNTLYFRLDKKKKLLVSTLLMSLAKDNKYGLEDEKAEGYSVGEILQWFYEIFSCTIDLQTQYIKRPIYEFDYNNHTFQEDVYDEGRKNIIIPKNSLFVPNPQMLDGIICWIHINDWKNLFAADDIYIPSSGTIIKEASKIITKEDINKIIKSEITMFSVLNVNSHPENMVIANTFCEDDCDSREEAYSRIVRAIRINDNNTGQALSFYNIFINTFFDEENYNLSEIGRIILNERLDIKVDLKTRHLVNEDIIAILKKFCSIIKNKGPMDDIDSLENKRLRLLGENFTNQCFIGARKMIRSMKDRLFMGESFLNRIKDVMSGKIFLYPLKKLLNVSVISQFEEQTNIISCLMHRRRLVYQSVSGTTAGNTKKHKRRIEAARDNHQSFYGKICPFSTPEGPNLGFVNSISLFATVDKYGILKTPYYSVKDGVVDTNQVTYMGASEEKKHIIAAFNDLEEKGGELVIAKDLIIGRRELDFASVRKHEVQYAEISSDQILSVSASLIPFAECNDAFRLLMASNMIRQADPLKRPQAPLVGTGIERIVVKEEYNGAIVSPCNGEILAVDANRIIILDKEKNHLEVKDLYNYNCSNQNTVYGHKAIVKVGDMVYKDQVIADSECSLNGELAIGNNALVAFISCAECFEDSILVSSKYAYDDQLTSHHIKVFEVQIRDSRVGHEMITRDIPGVPQDKLKHLDEEGIIMEGVQVSYSMILVGKVTPRTTHQLMPDQKLLHTIFGEKSSEISDTSFRAPIGTDGIITKVEIVRRAGIEENERLMAIEMKKIKDIQKNAMGKITLLTKYIREKIIEYVLNRTLIAEFVDFECNKTLNAKDCNRITDNEIKYSVSKLFNIPLSLEEKKVIKKYESIFNNQKKAIEQQCEIRIKNAKTGRELPAGVLKIVRIHIMEERRIQEGDKITGRHGNKGVISKIANQEDMPYLKDGTPVDIVMNPIGIKARMNPGLLMESVTGMACMAIVKKMKDIMSDPNYSKEELGKFLKRVGLDLETMSLEEKDNFFRNISVGNFFYSVAVQPFNRPGDDILDDLLDSVGKKPNGCEAVYDGKTGELLGDICVGYQYILKLCHMAKDKIHSRFTGAYSFITQQPLCGKSNNGGQRLGEMELWALEAYGVSYAIQEMITIKSDAVRSRYKAAESIVNGESLYRNVDKPSTLNILEKILASGGILMQLDYEKNTYERDVASYVNRKIMEKKSSEEEDLVSQLNLTMLG